MQRLAALARAIIDAVIAHGILKHALGEGAPASSSTQSVDLTATPYQEWRKEFRRDLALARGIVFATAGTFLSSPRCRGRRRR